jgi:formate/nitrite transporter
MTETELAAVRPDALAGAAIEAKAETVGEGKAHMPVGRAFLLAVLAGIFIGMGGMFMLLVKSDASLGFAASSVLGGLSFSVGLFFVLVAGAELFTGNNLMVLGALSGRYSAAELLRSWAVGYAGNLCGSLVLGALLWLANFAGMGGGAVGATMVSVAATKCALPWGVAFGRGILCNMLVCVAVWMGFAARTVVDKFLCAALPVATFVACGFEHCVANMFFIPMGIVVHAGGVAPEGAALEALNLGGLLSNLGAVTLGNIVGGAVVLAGTYWLAYQGGTQK